MKYLCGAFFVCMVMSVGYARADDLVHQDEFNMLISKSDGAMQEISTDHKKRDAGIKSDRDIKLDIMKTLDNMMREKYPDTYKNVKVKSDEERLNEYRNKVALDLFEFYKKYFMQKLEEKSKETGRVIKSDESGDGVIGYWLDKGKLDEPDCYNTKKRLACDYPDGFIECEISIFEPDSSTEPGLYYAYYTCDEPENDIRQEYNIDISIYNDSSTSIKIRAEVYSSEVNYTRWHQWRNQFRADVRTGMFDCLYQGDEICRGEELTKWESSTIPTSGPVKGKRFYFDLYNRK